MKILMIQLNSDGRPCAWGMSKSLPPPDLVHAPTFAEARRVTTEEAQRQWDAHSCYPGEKKGELVEHRLKEDGDKKGCPYNHAALATHTGGPPECPGCGEKF